MKCTSKELKVAGLCWLRFGKKFHYVATEVTTKHGLADVFGCSEIQSIEIEVKTSKADLKNDFTAKSTKHYAYNNAIGRQNPNLFYFLVPKELKDYAVTVLEENQSKAGLLSYDSDYSPTQPRHSIRSIKRPQSIHSTAPTAAFQTLILKRMASEICSLRFAIATKELDVEALTAAMLPAVFDSEVEE